MSSWLSPQWLCGSSCTWGHDVHYVHLVPNCMSCRKATVLIAGRAHCFHDCTYILRPSCSCKIWALCVSWITSGHLYKYIHYINIYTHTNTHTHTHIYIYMYIYFTYIHIYTHTHIYKMNWQRRVSKIFFI